ncbi:MAG: cation diffusion facilitator family transporter [Candidatus Binatia bacterium]|nr:cation diffusion facilitator family transporter [Candidatus Binatia bacterium]
MAIPSASTLALVDTQSEQRSRIIAGLVSLVVGSVLLGAKFLAYKLTGSAAVFSDALESIVNVVAAVFALGGLVFAGRPADRSHPYGHGKIEFFSAAFEGGLIAFAAVMILYEALRALIEGVVPKQLDVGIAITAGAGVANLLLGLYLVHTGRRCQSLALVADGQHVISDFWTSAGVVLGLAVVALTGIPWLDPLVAAAIAVHLGFTGFRLVRYAAGGLLDEEDRPLLEKLVQAMNTVMRPGIIRVHNTRAIRYGRSTHVDAHLVVPEFWTVKRAHDEADAFERDVIAAGALSGEIVFHTDPCRRLYCAQCELPDCPIRVEPFRERQAMTLEEIIQPDRPLTANFG